jgi:micrococcal nuclease
VQRWTVVVLTTAFVAGCTGTHSDATELPRGANAVVTKILDGDTVDVDVAGREERVRLIGIDTPEIAHDAFDGRAANDAECYGAEAQQYTEGLLTIGSGVRLERDVVARDDYGRLLAYVYRASDGAFVNYEIVRHGFAQPLTIAPNTHFVDLFVDAARTAEHDDVGLWAACRQE